MGGVISAYLPGTVSGNLNVTGSVSAGSSPGGPLGELVATTGAAGFALQNGTPNILTWTAPNDGNMHRFTIYGEVVISLAETGGQVTCTYTAPTGAAKTQSLQGGGAAAGTQTFTGFSATVGPGTTVTIAQGSALTAGAAIAYAEIWAS